MESEGHRKAVGIWIRVESSQHHETRARLYAEAKGWTIKKIYDPSGGSGRREYRVPNHQRSDQFPRVTLHQLRASLRATT
jgi:site-specific DNA recombinase